MNRINLHPYLGLFLLFVSLLGCGEGSFNINRDGPDASIVDLRGERDLETPDTEAKTYYLTNLFPIIQTDGTNWASDDSVKGCGGSGCHALNSGTPTFFQVDPTDEDLSWNYARVRRKLILYGDFAPEPPSGARTLRNRNLNSDGELLPLANRHQSFQNWSLEDFELIDTWTNLE